MGRVKLKIQRLESASGRQVTYSKRRAGILKKARELGILCDIDILLLMFSPTGKPTLCLGERSNFEEVIARFTQLTPQERAKRKLESLEALKKTFKKLDHDVQVEDFLGSSIQTVEELTNYSRLLQTQLSEIQKRLSYWADPDKINNIDHISALEVSLKESLSRIRVHKESFGKQLMSLECTTQNDMHFPLGVGDEQQPSPITWLNNNDVRHVIIPEDPNMLSQRYIGCSSDTSLQSFPGYFNTAKQSETNEQGQEDSLQDFSQNACLRLQLGGQYPYQSYGMNLLSEKKFQTDAKISLQEDLVDYQVNHFEPPRPGYDINIQNWASTSGSCSVATFDEQPYPQQPN